MSTIWTLLRATAVVVGSSAALVVGGLVGTAHADPAPPAPAPNIGQQLISTAANAPQLLQNVAAALGGTPPAPVAPPPPLAGATIQMPPAAAVPGTASAVPGAASGLPGITSAIPGATPAAPGLPALLPGMTPTGPAPTAAVPGIIPAFPPPTAAVPGITPAFPAATAAPPAGGPAALMPSAQIDLPPLPFLPVQLPREVSLPAALASLAPGGFPIPNGTTQQVTGVASSPGPAPATPPNPLLLPLSGLP